MSEPTDAFRHDTADAVETIDAALFTGDEFVCNREARRGLRAYCLRWLRSLDEHEHNDVDIG